MLHRCRSTKAKAMDYSKAASSWDTTNTVLLHPVPILFMQQRLHACKEWGLQINLVTLWLFHTFSRSDMIKQQLSPHCPHCSFNLEGARFCQRDSTDAHSSQNQKLQDKIWLSKGCAGLHLGACFRKLDIVTRHWIRSTEITYVHMSHI